MTELNKNEGRKRSGKKPISDIFIIPFIEMGCMIGVGALVGIIIEWHFLLNRGDNEDFWAVFFSNFSFVGAWLAAFLFFYFVQGSEPVIKTLGKTLKGNTLKNVLIGLLIGGLSNVVCVVVAKLHGDISFQRGGGSLLGFVALFVAIFIKSSAEEFLCRGFFYQRLRRGYANPLVAIVGNAVLFAALHLFNDGITVIAFLNTVVIAIHYTLMVYFFDSLWMPMIAHTTWNFMQNIIFGLPNDGYVSSYSLLKLGPDVSNSFAYDTEAGVESKIVALLVIVLIDLAIVAWGMKNKKEPTNIWIEQGEE